VCCDDFKCLQVEHAVLEACPPSRLAHLLEKVAMQPMALALLPPIGYVVELCITNRSPDALRLEHVYSSLAQPSKWSAVEVRQLNPDCSVEYPLPVDGDLLGFSGATGAIGVCLGTCQSLKLTVCLTGHCRFVCADTSPPTATPVLGGVNCTQLQDRLLICGSQPCTLPPNTVGVSFRKQHEIQLPA
jgi:hypothetical protein